jgi:hypothetical protein
MGASEFSHSCLRSALAIVAVLVVAVSIGMTTAIVTLVDGVLFHRLKDDARDRGIS